MKQLFWKEWHELRLLPLAAALCTILLTLGTYIFLKGSKSPFALDDTVPSLGCTCVLAVVASGAGLIAQEIGSGGLTLLSALPISRRRIWWVKVAAASGIALASVLTSLLAWVTIVFMTSRAGYNASPFSDMSGLLQGLAEMLTLLTVCFVSALAVSPFLDRPVSAIVAALMLGLGTIALLGNFASDYINYFSNFYGLGGRYLHIRDQEPIILLLVLLSIPAYSAISYWTFTRGENLRSAKRFRVGGLAGVVSLGAAGMLFWTGALLRWW